ncbi:hypothetical protein BDN72DRAFT_751234, partial [Pluteus cervinus]
LCSLRTLRNSLAPVSQIPTELLSKIFVHSQDCGDISIVGEIDLTTRLPISWVCRHWREIALATPALWTVIA